MKKVVFAIAGLLLSANVHARSVMPFMTAELEIFQMQPQSSLASVDSGNLVLSPLSKNIYLNLKNTARVFCFAAPCPQPVIAEFELQAKLIEVKTGECNETIYIGKEDLRPVDGVLTEIVVVDNSLNNCPTKRKMAATVVTLTIESLRGNKEVHTILGGGLVHH